jgi:choline-glycine betaine transporter
MAEKQNKFSRRTVALFWCVAIGIIIGALIYWEQIALLYVLATLVLVALLLIVGRADLEAVSRDSAGFSVERDKV